MLKIDGCVDMHIHSGPCLFKRRVDDIDVARDYREKRCVAIAIKSHHESTVGRAYITQKAVPGIHVFGGITLNYFVGGINPQAVAVALHMGGKIVWMPTMHSLGHAKAFGSTSGYELKSMQVGFKMKRIHPPITVLKEDGNLTDDIKDVIDLVQEYDAVFSTSHLSREEIFKVVQYIKNNGGAKVIIGHPFMKVPDLSIEELAELVKMGAFPELCATYVSSMHGTTIFDKLKKLIDRVGSENCVIDSDAGIEFKPIPSEMMLIFIQSLYEKGVSEADLDVMIKKNPRYLLGI